MKSLRNTACFWVVATLAAMAIGASAGDAQTGPAFERATVKPNTSGEPKPGHVLLQPGGRLLATNVTLQQLIQSAYQPLAFGRVEISGGPGWIDADRFDVEASAAGEHTLDEGGFPRDSWLMLRRLLAERFKLKVHTDSREVPAYALVFARGDRSMGARLRRSDVDCRAFNTMLLKGERPAKPTCAIAQYPGRIVAEAVTLPQLAAVLSRVMNRPIVDRTTLTGTFDVELEAAEITATGPFGPSYRPSDTKTSIFTALPAQLGLALESTTGASDVLVIDHAEKPAAETPRQK